VSRRARSSRRLPWGPLVAAGLLLAGSARAQEAPAAPAEEPVEGSFVLAEPVETARERIHAAIDRAVGEMPFFMRGFGRRRLRHTNPLPEEVRVELQGRRIVVHYGPDRTESEADVWTDMMTLGEPSRLLAQRAGPRVYQTYRGDDGQKRMVLTPSDDGSRLWLDVEVTSDRLPSPLTYRLSYRRVAR
jgi:hypothetical protein